MNKILKIVVSGLACFMLVANLHHVIGNYGLSTNSISLPIFAQTGSGTGGTSTGGGGTTSDPVPTACPEATITPLIDQKNDARSCNCTVKRRIVGEGSTTGGNIEYEYYTFRGIENTCKSGSSTCNAFACSSTQTGGGSSPGGDTSSGG